jgi:hypothetical protein
MRIRIAVPEEHVHPDVVNAALESVTRLNEHMIRAGQTPTSRELLAGGAVWRPENMGDEHFDHGGTIASRGWGDCDDWAPIHAATLRASGEDPGATAVVVPSGPSTYHAIVKRSSGEVEDPSIAAGMKAPSRVSGTEAIELCALDPHDGRIYQGSLLPVHGPLSMHSGVNFAVRGVGGCFEGRCDVPFNDSPLVHVHGRVHSRRRLHGVSVVGAVPYALSCTALGRSPEGALSRAVVGAILCGDAAEMSAPSLDRYKLLAIQAAMAGHSPGEVRDALVRQMHADIESHAGATGTHPSEHTQALLAQLSAETGDIHHLVISGWVVGDFFSDIGHIASAVVHTVSNVANDVAKVASKVPWGDIVHGIQAAVSVVPGLGTAVSDVIAAAETAYDAAAAALSGHPLLGAIDAAVNFALATVPGGSALRIVIDPAKKLFEDIVIKGEPPASSAIDAILAAVPDSPKIGPLSPRSIISSIGHLVIGHMGMKHTGQGSTPASTAAPAVAPIPVVPLARTGPSLVQKGLQAKAARLHAPARKPAPPVHPLLHVGPVAPKPLGAPHAAVHISLAPALAHVARAAAAAPMSPGLAAHLAIPPIHVPPVDLRNIPHTRRPGFSPWWHKPPPV